MQDKRLKHEMWLRPDDCRFCVVSTILTIHKPGATGHYVLERATNLDSLGILNHHHPEVGSLQLQKSM